MTQTQKNWIDHLKANTIPAIGMVGSFLWFMHTADVHWNKMESNQSESIKFQERTTVHLNGIDTHLNNLDTLKFQIRDLRNEMNYRFQTEGTPHTSPQEYATEYKDPTTGKIVLRKASN